jgi:hypothetical protein
MVNTKARSRRMKELRLAAYKRIQQKHPNKVEGLDNLEKRLSAPRR